MPPPKAKKIGKRVRDLSSSSSDRQSCLTSFVKLANDPQDVSRPGDERMVGRRTFEDKDQSDDSVFDDAPSLPSKRTCHYPNSLSDRLRQGKSLSHPTSDNHVKTKRRKKSSVCMPNKRGPFVASSKSSLPHLNSCKSLPTSNISPPTSHRSPPSSIGDFIALKGGSSSVSSAEVVLLDDDGDSTTTEPPPTTRESPSIIGDESSTDILSDIVSVVPNSPVGLCPTSIPVGEHPTSSPDDVRSTSSATTQNCETSEEPMDLDCLEENYTEMVAVEPGVRGRRGLKTEEHMQDKNTERSGQCVAIGSGRSPVGTHTSAVPPTLAGISKCPLAMDPGAMLSKGDTHGTVQCRGKFLGTSMSMVSLETSMKEACVNAQNNQDNCRATPLKRKVSNRAATPVRSLRSAQTSGGSMTSPMDHWEPPPIPLGTLNNKSTISGEVDVSDFEVQEDLEEVVERDHASSRDVKEDPTSSDWDSKNLHTSLNHTPCERQSCNHRTPSIGDDHKVRLKKNGKSGDDCTPCDDDGGDDHTPYDVDIGENHNPCDPKSGDNLPNPPKEVKARLYSSMNKELERQTKLSLQKKKSRHLSPLQQGLDTATQCPLGSFYPRQSIKPLTRRECIREASAKSFSLAKKSKSSNEENVPSRSVDNIFSKSKNSSDEVWLNAKNKKAPKLVDLPRPSLSTPSELWYNAQRIKVGRVHLGALKMVARDVSVDDQGLNAHLMRDNNERPYNISLWWEDVRFCHLLLELKPALIALQPTLKAVTKIVNRMDGSRTSSPPFLSAESVEKARKFILLELEGPPSPSVRQTVLETLHKKLKKDRIKTLSPEDSDDFLKMMDSCVQPPPAPRRSSSVRAAAIKKPQIVDRWSSEDEDNDSDLPDYQIPSDHSSRRSRGETTVNTATTIPSTTRRSTRSTVARRQPLPKIDFTYRPSFGGQCLRITTDDLSTLQEGEFLNDTVINFYLQYLLDRFPAVSRERVHVFSSFFFTRMSNTKADMDPADRKSLYNQERLHARVKNWTKSVDIFSKDFLIIPVCHASHWLVFIVFKPSDYSRDARIREIERERKSKSKTKVKTESGILHLDSSSQSDVESVDIETSSQNTLNTSLDSEEVTSVESRILTLDSLGSPRPNLARRIINYLNEEWRCKKDSLDSDHFNNIRIDRPKIPLQPNSSDCGVYLLHFIEHLFQKITREESLMDGDCFCSSEPTGMRKSLISLLQTLDSQSRMEEEMAAT